MVEVLRSASLAEDEGPRIKTPVVYKSNDVADIGSGGGNRRCLDSKTIKILDLLLNISLLQWLYIVYSFSTESHPAYSRYSHKLEQGWIFSYKVDNSDHQYASFRKNIPILLVVFSGHFLVSLLVRNLTLSSNSSSRRDTLSLRSKWTLLFSVLFLFGLFGASALKVLGLVSLHYWCVTASGPQSRIAPIISWTYSISILFLNDYFKGYTFGSILGILSPLDEMTGGGMRWNIIFNFTILRMISFTMDKYWALKVFDHNAFELHAVSCDECQHEPNLCKRQRAEQAHPYHMYSFTNYLIFCLYAPLYVAGPILSFNDFWHQMKNTPKSINARSTFIYALRWIGAVFLMEIMMHFAHVVAIKDTKAWKGLFSPMEIFLVGFFNLKMIWLKLVIIWRFFRMWAMCDGVETTENMGRCMSNHYSGIDFWREWHSSFNRWLIRYLYIPLGGSKTRTWNMFPIFSFVAIWHDIEGRLLAWGWLISLFILPEIVATNIVSLPAIRSALGDYHIHLCAFGGTVNILMMMAANLVGFAVGVEGLVEMSLQILDPKGIFFVVMVFFQIFGGTHRMFSWRELDRKAKKASKSL